jgi:hypothetical protein
MKKTSVLGAVALVLCVTATIRADRREAGDRRQGTDRRDGTLVVTSSNAPANELLVYDTSGTLLDRVSTQGQGGVSGNAGGIASLDGVVAVVNFGSQSVSILERHDDTFIVGQVVTAVSSPVSVAFGNEHLYILGTTTVESHKMKEGRIATQTDGMTALFRADGTAAQVGVVADQLVITEKSGVIEVVDLQHGAVSGQAASVPLPAANQDTPFGLVTRATNAYVTIAHSDDISLVKHGQLIALTAIGSGFPNGPGQQAPCWIALVGSFLFTSNSPSHSISRLIASPRTIVLDEPVAASTNGAPIDIAASGDHLAVVETDSANQSHITQFRIDEDGNLAKTSSTPIANPANGVAIVGE